MWKTFKVSNLQSLFLSSTQAKLENTKTLYMVSESEIEPYSPHIMLGPLSTNKEPAKTRTLMCWLPENIKELVREAGKDTENNYGKVTEFLLQWARPKTTV